MPPLAYAPTAMKLEITGGTKTSLDTPARSKSRRKNRRAAGYVCSVAVADPNGVIRLQVEASCRGRISAEPRGQNGFGYDPHFLIPEYHRTFGELSPLVKRHLSHRARAFGQLIRPLVELL